MEPLVAPWLPTLCEILAKGVNVQVWSCLGPETVTTARKLIDGMGNP